MRIALDAMGGDYAPKNTVEGAVLALKEYPSIEKLFLVGDAVATGDELKRLDFKDARIEIFHASEVVSMKESAAKAVRHKKDASICRAVDLVKNGSAHAVVSAGHTWAAVVACVRKNRLKWWSATGSPATWSSRPLKQSPKQYCPGSNASSSEIRFESSAQSSPKVHSSRFGKRPTMRSTVACRCSA